MKSRMKFITKAVLLLLVVTGCLSYRLILADDDKLRFSINSEVAESIEDESGPLVVDLYFIADIVWDGSNTEQTTYLLKTREGSKFKDDFDGLNVGVSIESGELWDKDNVDLDELANTAAGIVFGSETKEISASPKTLPVNTDNAVEKGLYLAIVRSAGTTSSPIDEDQTDKYIKIDNNKYYSFANSHEYEYIFNPYLVFVSGNNVNPIEMDTVDEDEETLVMLKYTRKERFGLMEIIKYVTVGGEPATTVFRVQGFESEESYKNGDDPIYEKVLAIAIKDADEYRDESLVLDDVLVDTYIVVTEEEPGASYELYKSEILNGSVITPVVYEVDENGEYVLDENGKKIPQPQIWTFYNKLSDINKKGYGIKNSVSKDGMDQTILKGGAYEEE